MKKVLITTGGSGGHVMPSLSVYDALKDNFEVHIATDLRGSKYIDSGSYNYSIIDVPKLSTSFLLILFNLIKFCFSILKSYKYLKSKKTILEKEPLESLAKKSQLKAFKHKSFWYSIDTKRDKENLEILIKNKKIPWNNFNHK